MSSPTLEAMLKSGSTFGQRLDALERDYCAAMQLLAEQELAIKSLGERLARSERRQAVYANAAQYQIDTLNALNETHLKRLNTLESALTPAIYSFAPTSVPIDTPRDGE